jgi:hypothetical protein
MGDSAKWTRRDTAVTGPRCAVDGCTAAAVTTLRTDAAAARAWLVDLGTNATGDDLCARHADALEAPAGWVLHDERERRARDDASIDRARRTRPRPASDGHARLDLRRPDADGGTVDDLLDAQSPLLSRAFAKSRDL